MGVLYTKDTKNWAIYNKKIKLETSKKDAIGNSRYRHFNNAIERGKLCEHERLMQEKKKRKEEKKEKAKQFMAMCENEMNDDDDDDGGEEEEEEEEEEEQNANNNESKLEEIEIGIEGARKDDDAAEIN